METERLFIAINLPTDLKEYLAKVQQEYKKNINHVKWVEEDNFHLTLKFLGDVPVDGINRLSEAVKNGLEKIEPFYITIREIGVFPKINQAKVIWLGVDEGKNKIINMFKAIDTALEEVGFQRESKAYKPHLTIGRCREPQYIDISKLHSEFCGGCQVESIDIMRSQLTPRGPIYTIKQSINLITAKKDLSNKIT